MYKDSRHPGSLVVAGVVVSKPFRSGGRKNSPVYHQDDETRKSFIVKRLQPVSDGSTDQVYRIRILVTGTIYGPLYIVQPERDTGFDGEGHPILKVKPPVHGRSKWTSSSFVFGLRDEAVIK
jgi:hypothetical protein